MDWMKLFVSVDSRRRRWRLTPFAEVALVVVLLLLLAGALWVQAQIRRAMAVVPLPSPTPTAVAAVAGGEESTIAPTVAVATPTATSVPAFPPTWEVRLARDGDGRPIGVVDDPAVLEAVRQAFLDTWTWLWQPDVPQNPESLEYYFAPLPTTDDPVFQKGRWRYDLESTGDFLARMARSHTLPRILHEAGGWSVQVERFSTNGRLAVVRARHEGMCRIDVLSVDTGQSVGGSAEPYPCPTWMAGLVYSNEDGRWRVANMYVP